jgi:hypothetical protein
MRRRCVEAFGGLPIGPPILENIQFLSSATRRFGVRYLDRPALCYRVGPSLMHSQPDLSHTLYQSYLHLWREYRRKFGALEFYVMKAAARSVFRYL